MLPYIKLNLDTNLGKAGPAPGVAMTARQAAPVPTAQAPAAQGAGAGYTVGVGIPQPAVSRQVPVPVAAPDSGAASPASGSGMRQMPEPRKLDSWLQDQAQAAGLVAASGASASGMQGLPAAYASSQPSVLLPLSTNALGVSMGMANASALSASKQQPGAIAASQRAVPSVYPTQPSRPEYSSTYTDHAAMRNALSVIFRRLGKPGMTQAVSDLHFFLQANPGCNMVDEQMAEVCCGLGSNTLHILLCRPPLLSLCLHVTQSSPSKHG